MTIAPLRHYVALSIAQRHFGVAVDSVRNVVGPQRLSAVPLAPRIVAGALSHRGRIVTAIDLRQRLGLDERDPGDSWMGLIVAHEGALYGLLADTVDTVLAIDPSRLEPLAPMLDPRWRSAASAIYRAADTTTVILEIGSLLDPVMAEAA